MIHKTTAENQHRCRAPNAAICRWIHPKNLCMLLFILSNVYYSCYCHALTRNMQDTRNVRSRTPACIILVWFIRTYYQNIGNQQIFLRWDSDRHSWDYKLKKHFLFKIQVIFPSLEYSPNFCKKLMFLIKPYFLCFTGVLQCITKLPNHHQTKTNI